METQDYSRLNVKKAKGLRPDKRNTGESQPEAMDTTAAAVVDYADIGGDVDWFVAAICIAGMFQRTSDLNAQRNAMAVWLKKRNNA